jgi:hypothetical protein
MCTVRVVTSFHTHRNGDCCALVFHGRYPIRGGEPEEALRVGIGILVAKAGHPFVAGMGAFILGRLARYTIVSDYDVLYVPATIRGPKLYLSHPQRSVGRPLLCPAAHPPQTHTRMHAHTQRHTHIHANTHARAHNTRAHAHRHDVPPTPHPPHTHMHTASAYPNRFVTGNAAMSTYYDQHHTHYQDLYLMPKDTWRALVDIKSTASWRREPIPP